MLITVVVIVYLVSAAVSLIIAGLFWNRRDYGEWVLPSFALALAAAVWSLSQGMEIAAPTLAAKLFWSKMAYLGIVWMPPIWYVLALQRANWRQWLTKSWLAALMIVPLITLLLAFTNGIHHLFWTDAQLVQELPFLTVSRHYSSWIRVFAVYSGTLRGVGAVALLGVYGRYSQIYRRQNQILLIAMLIPVIFHVARNLGISPFAYVDVTPLALTISVVILAVHTLNERLFDITPLPHQSILSRLDVGVLALNAENRIIEINAAALNIFNVRGSDGVGLFVEELPANQSLMALVWESETAVSHEIPLAVNGKLRQYDVNVIILEELQGGGNGRLITFTDITRQNQAEDTLRKSAEDLGALVASMDDLVFTLNRYGVFLDYYQPSQNVELYVDPEHFVGKSVRDVLPPRIADKLDPALINLAATGESQQFDYVLGPPDGESWFDVKLSTRLDSAGRFIGATAVVRNVTERVQTEKALQESERRYRLLATNSTDIIWTIDMDLRFTYISPSVEYHRGYTAEEALALPMEQTMPADSLERIKERFSRTGRNADKLASIRHFPPQTIIFENYCKDGSLITVESNMTFLFGPEGRPTGFMGISRNITERNRMENALRKSEKDLLEAQRIAHIGNWSHDLRTGKIKWSDEMFRIVGRDKQEVSRDWLVSLFHSGDRERIESIHEKAQAGQQYTDFDVRVVRPDGEIRYIHDRWESIFDDAGQEIKRIGTVQDITERVWAEEEIRKLYRAVEQSASAVYIADLQGQIEFVNPAFSEMTGHLAQDAIGQNVRILKSGQHSPEFFEKMRKALLNGDVWQGEIINKKKNGDFYWAATTISPVKSGMGETTHFLTIKENITQQKKASEAIAASELKLRRLTDNISDMIVQTDAHGVIQYASPSCEIFMGYEPHKSVGLAVLDLVRFEEGREVWRRFSERMLSGEPGQNEFRIHDKYGRSRNISVRGNVIKETDGSPIGAVFIGRDITDQKRMEAALQNTYDKLEHQLDEMIALNDIMQALSKTTDLNSALDLVTYSMTKLFDTFQCGIALLNKEKDGLVVTAQYTTNLNQVSVIGEIIPLKDNILTQRVIQTGKPVIVSDVHNNPLATEATRKLMVSQGIYSLMILPLMARGEVIGTIGIDLDRSGREFSRDDIRLAETVTGQIASVIANARLLDEQAQLIEELDAYALTVAHDLKNPLTAIDGYATILQEDGSSIPLENYRFYLSEILGGAERMGGIIDTLLLLADVRKREEIIIEEVDMAAVISEAMARLYMIINGRDVEIKLPKAWPSGMGYAPWIGEIWANYISNGIKYGGQPCILEFGADVLDDNIIRYWIQDNGAGLSLEEQAKLFAPFTRLHQKTKIRGHGLGLSIVQRIAKKLNGSVGVESVPGIGSRFYFTLSGVINNSSHDD